ncbi:hypothetical protein SAMN05878482_11085 [Peribacillus simplex]|uniref:Ankyrin repeat domain-containing protein n=1 Tax=Peribacillus simplex TaxID=1478 RepID=A0A9X8WN01_9BACI|nr:ankyrin repeat domain-containing protein [Peribacillus simplex]SIS04295.1 hypothetical protein SAMN05878482_11085 [Peribacillus simplex]
MIATYNNDIETTKVLIKAGTDVNIPDRNNVTHLHAREKEFKEIEQILLKPGAE